MDAETLTLLEEKILRVVAAVNRLKKELEVVRAERDALLGDKEAVRQRVEKLLETIDSLASS